MPSRRARVVQHRLAGISWRAEKSCPGMAKQLTPPTSNVVSCLRATGPVTSRSRVMCILCLLVIDSVSDGCATLPQVLQVLYSQSLRNKGYGASMSVENRKSRFNF